MGASDLAIGLPSGRDTRLIVEGAEGRRGPLPSAVSPTLGYPVCPRHLSPRKEGKLTLQPKPV